MQEGLQLVILAILVESVWESLKMVWEEGKFSVDTIGTLVLGVMVSIVVNIDVFSIVGISTSWSMFGVVLTGVLISRGGNFIHDLLSKIEGGNK